MAVIKFVPNIYEEDYKEVEYNPEKPLLQHIEEFADNGVYEDYLVEAYDSETGEVFKTLLVDDSENPCVIIIANNEVVTSEYKVQDSDIVTVCFLPLSNTTAEQWKGGVLGALAGTLLGGIAGGVVGLQYSGGNWIGALVGAIIGSAIGLIGGFVVGWAVASNIIQPKNDKLTNKQGNLADIRGADNQLLVGNNFPFVFGKHLITPFIVGNPVVSFTQGDPKYIEQSLLPLSPITPEEYVKYMQEQYASYLFYIVPLYGAAYGNGYTKRMLNRYPWIGEYKNRVIVNPTTQGNRSYTRDEAVSFYSVQTTNSVSVELDWNESNLSEQVTIWGSQDYTIYQIERSLVEQWIKDNPEKPHGTDEHNAPKKTLIKVWYIPYDVNWFNIFLQDHPEVPVDSAITDCKSFDAALHYDNLDENPDYELHLYELEKPEYGTVPFVTFPFYRIIAYNIQ